MNDYRDLWDKTGKFPTNILNIGSVCQMAVDQLLCSTGLNLYPKHCNKNTRIWNTNWFDTGLANRYINMGNNDDISTKDGEKGQGRDQLKRTRIMNLWYGVRFDKAL